MQSSKSFEPYPPHTPLHLCDSRWPSLAPVIQRVCTHVLHPWYSGWPPPIWCSTRVTAGRLTAAGRRRWQQNGPLSTCTAPVVQRVCPHVLHPWFSGCVHGWLRFADLQICRFARFADLRICCIRKETLSYVLYCRGIRAAGKKAKSRWWSWLARRSPSEFR